METKHQPGEFSADASHTANGSVAVDELLSHAGVKGMRWGVRKGVTSTPAKTSTATKPLSDKQLKATVERLRLEKQLSELTSKSTTGKGKKFINTVLEQQGNMLIGMVIGFAAKQVLNNAQYKIDIKNAPKMAAVDKARKAASVLA